MLLSVENLKVKYGNIQALHGVSFHVNEGEIVTLIGANGAGKTTMFNLITGTMSPDKGSVYFQGKDVTKLSAARRCRSGMARSFQVPQPFSGMTVFENAMIAATQAAGLSGRKAEQSCLTILEQTGLLNKANVLAGSLNLLGRKRLELTRALCAKPKLLMLDEIAGGLTEAECVSLVQTIKDIRLGDVSIIWIEHVVHALIAVVDRLLVIDFGKKIADGIPKDIMATKEVQEIYLGIEVDC